MGEIIKVDTELYARADRLSKRTPGLSVEELKQRKKEHLQCIKDLEFEIKAKANKWTEEERLKYRAEFDRRYDEEQEEQKRLNRIALDVLLFDGKGLSEEEILEGKEYLKENPDLEDVAYGVINMIDAGVNDPEQVMDYK